MGEIFLEQVQGYRDAVQVPDPVWPVIEALRTPDAVRWSDAGETTLPRFTPADAGQQAAEKTKLPATSFSVEYVDAGMVTFGNTVDVSLQARRYVGSTQPFVDVLTAFTEAEANRYVIAQLEAADTAAGHAPNVSAAIQAVAPFGGPILVVTSSIAGAGDLREIVRAARGRLDFVWDPDVLNGVLVIARVGVSLDVKAGNMSGVQPSIHGVDVATYATVIGPVVAPGAVRVADPATVL